MKPHVLTLPSWYPIEEDPLMGFFFKEQARWLIDHGCKSGVIYPEVRSLRLFTPPLAIKNRFQVTSKEEDGLWTVRSHGWNRFPKMEKTQMHSWVSAAERLFLRYCSESGKPDVLHVHSSLWGGVAAAEISAKHSIPYVITEHHSSFLLNKTLGRPIEACWSTPYIQKSIQNSAQFIAVSSALEKALQNYIPKQMHVIPLPSDTHFFTPASTPPSQSPYRLFCLAKLVPGKNIELLLHAMARLKGRPFLLEIGGFGSEELKLKKLTRELCLNDTVRFLGKLDRMEARNAFRRAHCFVLPSDFETQGCVYVEAMSCGLPSIATRCGGPEDTLTPETGILIPVNDLEALVNAILTMPTSSYDRKKIRARAEEFYSPESYTRRILKVLSL